MSRRRKPAPRRVLHEWGVRGGRRIIVVRFHDPRLGVRYAAEWYPGGRPKRKRFADEASARAWAESWYTAPLAAEAERQNLTLRQLLDRYLEVQSEKRHWRGSTVQNYRNHATRILQAIGPTTPAAAVGVAHLDTLWTTLTRMGMAPNQIRAKVKLLQRVYAWALARRLVPHNDLPGFDLPETKPREIAEYDPADPERLLAQWDYTDGWQWRPWAVTMIAATHGFRINALLNLEWSDVDWATARVALRAEHDKTKRDWSRPLTWDAYAALLTARWHRDRLGKISRYVFYGSGRRGGGPYTYQAYWRALRTAEQAAGVVHQRGRAAHGFRRMVVGNIRQQTGDAALGLLWVGDRDLRQAKSYVKEREDELAGLAETTGGEGD